MKQTQSFRLAENLVMRLENLATASRIKKGTLIEMCIEEHLPHLEQKYKDELAKLVLDSVAAATKRLPNSGVGKTHKGSGDTAKLNREVADAEERGRKSGQK